MKPSVPKYATNFRLQAASLLCALCTLNYALAQQYGWTDISASLPDYPYDIVFINNGADTGFAHISDISFMNDYEGWVTTWHAFSDQNAAILHMTDGGESWTVSQVGYFKEYTHIHFTDANTGWISGSEGYMLRTTDGGTTWTQVYLGTHQSQNVVYFFDEENGFLVGNGGMLLHTSNGGYTGISVEKIKQDQIDVSLLPNPFHESTSIGFELPADTFLTIEILDHTGRLVSVPARGHKSAGPNQVVVAGSSLPSGIFFVRVSFENQMIVKKIVKL
ncbi:MAG: hypothetical protein FD170_3458 [Bacteroidetes bacterium]|nr:MAG: hypothetical protein FD170_3458 [Bacteroidota bacterium]